MKKITLSLAGLLMSCLGFAQVGIVQDFPTTTLPAGWISPGGFLTTSQTCASASWRVNIYGSVTESSLTTPLQASNGTDLTISFAYKVVNWSAATVATNPYDGTITTEVSLDGGDSWGVTAGVIDNSNHVVANTCATVTYVVPGSEVPAGSDVRIRWRCNFGTSGDYYVYIDNISATQTITTPPACAIISSPAEGAVNVLSPIISWADGGGLPTGYRLTVGTTPTGTEILNNVDLGNVTTYNLGSLLTGTTYYVTVIPYNAFGNATACNPLSFTSCGASTVPFLEVFDTANPDCWARGTGGSPATGPTAFPATNSWIADGFANNGATGAIKNNIYQAVRNDWFISPAITIPTNGYELRFDAAAVQWNSTTAPTTPWESDDFIQVLVQVEGTTTWQEVYQFNSNNQPSATGSPYIVPLAAYAGQTIKVAFRAFEGTQDGAADIDFSIDNFEISPIPTTAPNCTSVVTPADGAENIVSSLVTWESATGSPTGYRLTVGTTPTGTEVLNNFDVGNVTSYNIGSLLSGTTYYVTVIPYNASGNATGCLTSTFSTCGALTVPLLEPFDVASPQCWTRGNGGEPATGPTSQVATNTWVADGFANNGSTGAIRIYIDGASKNAWIISPAISIPTNGYELRFNAAATQSFSTTAPSTPWEADDFVQVLVQVEGTTTWQQLLLFNNNNVPPAAGVAYNASLAAYSGQNIRIAFRGVEGANDGFASIDFSFDDFEITETQAVAPDCTSIVTPADGAENVQSPLITWAGATGFPTGYRLTIGTTPTGTEILNNVDVGNVTSYNLGSLLAGTTYYITVTPFNTFGSAAGCTTSSFSTCDLITAPHLEDFSVATPACWTRGTGGNTTTGPANFVASNSWYNDGFANVGFTGAPTINIWQATRNEWFISPAISIPATGYELKFDAAANEYGDDTQTPVIPWEADDFVQVLVQVEGTTTWQEVVLFNANNLPPAAGQAYIVDLDAYAGQNIRVAFRGVEGTDNGSADIEFSFDNFEIRETPSTAPACATNIAVDADPACGNFANTITWDASAGADGYILTIGTTAGGTEIVNAQNLGNTTTYTFTGTIGTTYYILIVPFNGAGNAAGCNAEQFTTSATGCYCTSEPESVDGEGVTEIVIENDTFNPTNTVLYLDNTASPITIGQGEDVNISMTFNTFGGFASYTYDTNIWVDYNNNFVFEASEIVFTGDTPAESPTVLTGAFTVPSATALGQYRMRIATADSGQETPNPCYNGFYGMTFDFTLNVDQASGIVDLATGSLKVYPNPVKDVLTLTSTAEISKVEVYNLIGQLVITKNLNASEAQINMAGLNAGAYIVNITSEGAVKTVKIIKE